MAPGALWNAKTSSRTRVYVRLDIGDLEAASSTGQAGGRHDEGLDIGDLEAASSTGRRIDATDLRRGYWRLGGCVVNRTPRGRSLGGSSDIGDLEAASSTGPESPPRGPASRYWRLGGCVVNRTQDVPIRYGIEILATWRLRRQPDVFHACQRRSSDIGDLEAASSTGHAPGRIHARDDIGDLEAASSTGQGFHVGFDWRGYWRLGGCVVNRTHLRSPSRGPRILATWRLRRQPDSPAIASAAFRDIGDLEAAASTGPAKRWYATPPGYWRLGGCGVNRTGPGRWEWSP